MRTTNRPVKLTSAEFAGDPRWNGVGPEGVWHPRQRGWLAAPLVRSDGLNMGLIQVSHKRDGEFDDDDRADLVELATIASVAVENVQLEERERQLSRTLQSSLLPRSLPLIHGIDLAARYVPSGEGATAGGDWYDAFVLPDDRLALVIGDVVGHGPDAAATMGQLRSALAAWRPARPTTVRGWGIKMMRHEMDHVDLRRHHDGTEVVLRLDVDMRARSAKIAHAPSLPASL